MTTVNNDLEQHIINVARQVFIEKGFVETSMSDIAAAAGINRSGLHYYFRTKDRMFEAVFADIVSQFVPAIQHILTQDTPIGERAEKVIDVYLATMLKNPSLPMFMIREAQRNSTHIIETFKNSPITQFATNIKGILQHEMECGKIKKVPLEHIIYSLYGAILFPFLAKPLTNELQLTDDETFADTMRQWKNQIIKQIELLLSVD